MSKEIKTERGLLRYLHMLMALRGRPHLALLSTATRVRLQVRRQAGRGWRAVVWQTAVHSPAQSCPSCLPGLLH